MKRTSGASSGGRSNAASTNVAETPATKRRRLFDQLRDESLGRKIPPRVVRNVDDLDEFEIRECFKIANGMVKAHSRGHHATSALMEDFLKLVFSENWTPNDGLTGSLLPLDDVEVHYGLNTVGTLVRDSVELSVFYMLEVCMSPIPTVSLKLCDEDGGDICEDELCNFKWHLSDPNEVVRSGLEGMGEIEEDIVEENRHRAKFYARDMIRRRVNGDGLQTTAVQYEFFDFVHIFNMCRAFQMERLEMPIRFNGDAQAESNRIGLKDAWSLGTAGKREEDQ